jgi:hypothetical protein
MGGHTTLTAHACAAAHSQMASLNRFTTLTTTPPCPAGSRAWRPSFGSVVCGPREIFSPSAQDFIAPLAAPIAAADGFYFCSPISYRKSPSFKSWLSLAATCATSTQNTIASSTSSNNTGEQRNSVSVWQGARQRSTRWRGRSSNASMMSPFFIFGGESFRVLSSDSIRELIMMFLSYANRAARFISAYRAGLSGSQAAWANRKYHSHRTLPPEIIAEVKRSVAS